jgi:hypothetical protein
MPAAVRCVVSTTDASYLYSLTRPALMCTYPHTGQALQVRTALSYPVRANRLMAAQAMCTSTVLCSISGRGLDMWILRTQQVCGR